MTGSFLNPRIVSLVQATRTLINSRGLPLKLVICGTINAIDHDGAPDAMGQLASGEADIAVLYGTPALYGALGGEELYREPFAVFIASSSVFASRDAARLSDLADATFLFPTIYPAYVADIVAACRSRGFEPCAETHYFESFGDMMFDRENFNIVVAPSSLTQTVLPAELSGLRRVQLDDPAAVFHIWAVWREDSEAAGVDAINPYLEILRECVGLMSSG